MLLSKVRVSERLATAHIAQLGSYQRFLASIYHYEGHYPVWKAQYEYRQCLTAWVDTLFEQRAWFSIEQLEQIDLYLGRIVDAFATLYKHHRPAFMHLQTSLWHDDHLPYARGAHLFRSWEVVAQEREADLIEARLIKKAPGKGVAVLIPCLTAAHEQPKDLKAPYLFDNELSQEEQAQVKFRLYLNGVEINRLLGYDDFMIWLDTYQISPYSKRAAQIECGVPVDTSDGTVRWDRIAPL
ncbi:hypothetical protein [Pokkaliibacter plantistimulans]|uniref:hypothetical protein n=1 Tax=Pokkaliibacter plantistimulans TaxID=1635171 RepID=UPI0010579E57|nr:hypothetical protein [Pokkaliibacter plantistimulans]